MTGKWKTDQDYRALAVRRGFMCLVDELPTTTRVEIDWQCGLGHIWKATYNHIDQGYGCPFCSGNHPKTLDDYHVLAQERGFICLLSEVIPTHHKARWRCKSAGHEWEASYHNIKGRNSGCPYCSRCVKLTAGDYAQLANSRNFVWCGEFPKHTLKVTTWQCLEGHTWRASYNTIAKGEGCPHCQDMVNGSLASKPQRKLHEMLGGTMNHQVSRYSVDIALTINGTNIGVEYDASYWHQDQERDAKRDAYLTSQGWRMLHVKSKSGRKLPSREQLNSAIDVLLQTATHIEIVVD